MSKQEEIQKASTKVAIVMIIAFVAGWFIHGFFNKQIDYTEREANWVKLKQIDDQIIEAFYIDDIEKSVTILLNKNIERKEILNILNTQ